MWSGPRNISTAMMRAWSQRDDTFVCDEPLYAHYLHATRKPHPGMDAVIAAGETDWKKAVTWLSGPVPEGRRVFFQKHMTHHLLPHIDRVWLGKVTNCFLIRHPREVLLSYAKIIGAAAPEDTGFPQQREIFEWVRTHQGRNPLVLDARDVQNDPRRMLGLLCDCLGLDFQESMLSWPPGIHANDGVWAPHWYKEVETSTGFRPHQAREGELPPTFRGLYDECLASYETLYAARLTP